MQATWLDTNSWLLELGGMRLLVDPWLVGPLTFGGQGWLFKGVRPRPVSIPENIDLILLSQGLEDHAHPATLEVLDKSIPVVGSDNAAKVARAFGFTQVIALSHGDRHTIGTLDIEALPGAPIGPTLRENGYILRESDGVSVFYEPHGFHSDLEPMTVDVVITPVIDITLPLLGPVLRGQQGAIERVEALKPRVVLPTAGVGEAEYGGVLLSLLKTSGSPQSLQAEIDRRGLKAQVMEPQVEKPVDLTAVLAVR
ncbi:Zn-dependent hydrolase [filamentous cyanobacterium CCP5]|nr:Zn-dependent hydrolase [filamentous cyanobacterium CCP5]